MVAPRVTRLAVSRFTILMLLPFPGNSLMVSGRLALTESMLTATVEAFVLGSLRFGRLRGVTDWVDLPKEWVVPCR